MGSDSKLNKVNMLAMRTATSIKASLDPFVQVWWSVEEAFSVRWWGGGSGSVAPRGQRQKSQIKERSCRCERKTLRKNDHSPSERLIPRQAAVTTFWGVFTDVQEGGVQSQLTVVLCCLLRCQDERSQTGKRLRHLQKLVLEEDGGEEAGREEQTYLFKAEIENSQLQFMSSCFLFGATNEEKVVFKSHFESVLSSQPLLLLCFAFRW